MLEAENCRSEVQRNIDKRERNGDAEILSSYSLNENCQSGEASGEKVTVSNKRIDVHCHNKRGNGEQKETKNNRALALFFQIKHNNTFKKIQFTVTNITFLLVYYYCFCYNICAVFKYTVIL